MSAQRFAFVCVQTILLIHNHVLGYPIASANDQKCEVLTIPMCKNLGYNATFMPNRFNHKTQKDAALEIDKFSPFVEAGCSPMLQLFLCSLYAPPCNKDNINGKGLLPCRSVCKNATAGCLTLMKDYGVKLPERMVTCDLWPSKSDDKTCLFGRDTRRAISRSSSTKSSKAQVSLVLGRTVKDEILTTVTLKNLIATWLKLKRVTVTLMLFKNNIADGFFLTDASVNLLTIASPRAGFRAGEIFLVSLINNSLNSMRMINTSAVTLFMTMTNNSLNSLTLINTTIGHVGMTNNFLNSFTLMNTMPMVFPGCLNVINNTLNSFRLINTSTGSINIRNSALNSLTLVNASTSKYIEDSTVNSLTIMNTSIGYIAITDSTVKLLTLINTNINSLEIKNTNIKSFTLITP